MIESVIPIGRDWQRAYPIVNSAGAAVNLTGWTVNATLTIGASATALTCSVIDAAGGIASLALSAAQTAALPAPYVGEVEVWLTQGALKERAGLHSIRTEKGGAGWQS